MLSFVGPTIYPEECDDMTEGLTASSPTAEALDTEEHNPFEGLDRHRHCMVNLRTTRCLTKQ